MTHKDKIRIENEALVDVNSAVGNLDSARNYYLWLVLSRMVLDFDANYDSELDTIELSISVFESAIRHNLFGITDDDRISLEKFFVRKFYNVDISKYSDNIRKVLDADILLTTELKLMLIRNCETKDNRFDL